MNRPFNVAVCLLFLACILSEAQTHTKPSLRPSRVAQSSATADTAKSSKLADFSTEAFVIENLRTAMRFENDGTGEREVTGVIDVQSEAGVQGLGQLVWGYNSSNERLDVRYVRVRRTDGTVITAGPEAVQDLSSPVSREAPMYTDYRQKHVTVPGLRPGDKLEYQFATTIHTPFAAGQFWAEHDFIKDAVVLNEELEINVPRARATKLKTAKDIKETVVDEGDRRVYRWVSSNLKRNDENDEIRGKKKEQHKSNEPEPPAVQLTTFASWEEVGRWYASLEKDRRVATPELRAKAAALIAGHNTDREKVEALYNFVAGNYRYVSLSFGIGRYQPHAAADVLANEYGDCKDKHTLLATLVQATGFQASTVLIHSARKIDESLPSPAQFDHVITLVRMGTETAWLDTTTEVAPFGMLVLPLRDKQALVIPPDAAAYLAKTPAKLPFESFNRTDITGEVSEVGKLTRHTRAEYRGDAELLIRAILRRLPEAQWKGFAEFLEMQDGRPAEVTGFKVANLNATREPLEIGYDAATANYLDWSSKKAALKLPIGRIEMPDVADEDDDVNPVKLGEPSTTTWALHLTLPAKYRVTLPLPITVTRDYAEYKSEYEIRDNKVEARRSLVIRKNELPPERRADFRAFWRSIQTDFNQQLALESKGDAASALPESKDADELENAADAASNSRNYETAITLYKRVVALEPKYKYAWNNMGLAQLNSGRLDDAIASFTKAIEVNPYEEYAYNNLGRVLWRQQKYDEAAANFRKQIEINPLDQWAHNNLGRMYLEQKKYAEALPELEKAAAITPNDPSVKVEIGQAELNLGEDEKAFAKFDEALSAMPIPLIWNNIAYDLAVKKVHLDRALRYAESAVTTTISALRNLNVSENERQELTQELLTTSLATYWDTLGWIYYQRGDLEKAERYIRASWDMSQHGEVGGHLARIYEDRGEKEKAIDQYARALATGRSDAELQSRLAGLLGSNGKVSAEIDKRRALLSEERSVKLGKLLNEDASAEFALVFSSGPAVEMVEFLKGSEKLKPFADVLKSTTYKVTLPDDSPVRLFRRGILSCSKLLGNCSLVLMTASENRLASTQTPPVP
jgi:tetratricopeptide (TPR) repeat protein